MGSGKPALMSRWAADLRAERVHAEYPRPQMVRPDWLNLNGLWDYAITHRDSAEAGAYGGQILVPFPVESPLSRVNRMLGEQQKLWYRRKFDVPARWHNRRVLLHFEAVDWEARIWVNGIEQGVHRGGYDRFSFDITDALKPEAEQELVVSVFDPTESGDQPRGKQMLHPRGTFYPASSGIWQTVWLEAVGPASVSSLRLAPDVDSGILNLTVSVRGDAARLAVAAVALRERTEVARVNGKAGEVLRLPIPNAKLWAPGAPFLYDLEVKLLRDGRELDAVSSYFAMRKISVGTSKQGLPCLELNNQPLFQFGALDQGYWPDGLYTAPSDEALRSDVQAAKDMGFNLLRKHVKVEPDRWYYWCDKVGMLVWQDMPSGDQTASAKEKEIQRRAESARQFESELEQMVVGRGNHPCIVMWIAFNQGWGQYETAQVSGLIKGLDPWRPVIDASGWHDLGGGDVRALHEYPGRPRRFLTGDGPAYWASAAGWASGCRGICARSRAIGI